MRKQTIAILLVLCIVLSGCGGPTISQEEYNEVVKHNEELQKQNENLQKEYDKLYDKYSKLESNTKNENPTETETKNKTVQDNVSQLEVFEKNTETSTDKHTATTGEQNALSKAKQYLGFSAFSYKGLIEQLEYEKFSHEEAVYGVDNCGADWNEQAVKKAQQYLEFMPFSKDGLIEQLEFEGFTHEEAIYGAEQNGY